MRLSVAATLLVMAAMPVCAHRLDEYLQGTILSVDKNRLQAQMTMTPGVSVFAFLIAYIDLDADGVISETEKRAYAKRVLGDLTIGIDGRPLTPQMLSIRFPSVDEMKDGRGEIQIDFNVDLPGGGHNRKLTFENHHLSRISAYQVNCLVPRDSNIRIAAQERNDSQSLYQLKYVETNVRSDLTSVAPWLGGFGGLGLMALLLFTRVGFLWRQRVLGC